MHSKGKKKISLVRFGLVAAAFAAVVGITVVGVSTASANPGQVNACTNCHTYHGGSLRISTDIASKTVAPGESFAVNIAFTGGGSSRTEVNWSHVLNNALFSPTPDVPFSAPAAVGNTSSTLTAPTTPGTYTIRVYVAHNSPVRETDYKDITIIVTGVEANYTVNASAGTGGNITPSANPVGSGNGGSDEENDDDDDIGEIEHAANQAGYHDNEQNRNNHENDSKKNHGDDNRNKGGDKNYGDVRGQEKED